MRNLIWVVILSTCCLVGCTEKKGIQTQQTSKPDTIISLQYLLDHQEEYKDKQVAIAAYFISHFEGAWISGMNGDPNERFEPMLAIKHNLSAKFDVLDSTSVRLATELGFDENHPSLLDRTFSAYEVYHEFTDGLSAIIIGTFRVGDYSYPNGLDLENHPYIELIKVREISETDTRWKAARSKSEPVERDNR